MHLTMVDHDYCLRACEHPKITEDEKSFLSMMASLAAANEAVSREDYNKVQRLTGGHLTLEGSIFDRK